MTDKLKRILKDGDIGALDKYLRGGSVRPIGLSVETLIASVINELSVVLDETYQSNKLHDCLALVAKCSFVKAEKINWVTIANMSQFSMMQEAAFTGVKGNYAQFTSREMVHQRRMHVIRSLRKHFPSYNINTLSREHQNPLTRMVNHLLVDPSMLKEFVDAFPEVDVNIDTIKYGRPVHFLDTTNPQMFIGKLEILMELGADPFEEKTFESIEGKRDINLQYSSLKDLLTNSKNKVDPELLSYFKKIESNHLAIKQVETAKRRMPAASL